MTEKKTARLIRGPWTTEFLTERCLWQTSDGEHIVTSSVPPSPETEAGETLAFRGDETGELDFRSELGAAPVDAHAGAIRSAGYEVVEGKN